MAANAVVSFGLSREIDPHSALLEELHRTAGHVAWLGLQVQQLEADDLHEPVGGQGGGYPRTEPSVWLRLYGEERRHLADVARSCIACGLEERRGQIAEEQGQLIATAIRGILTDLGVADRPDAGAVVRRHLTAVR